MNKNIFIKTCNLIANLKNECSPFFEDAWDLLRCMVDRKRKEIFTLDITDDVMDSVYDIMECKEIYDIKHKVTFYSYEDIYNYYFVYEGMSDEN